MTNAPFGSIEDFRDIESVNHYRHAVAAGADPQAVLTAALGRYVLDEERATGSDYYYDWRRAGWQIGQLQRVIRRRRRARWRRSGRGARAVPPAARCGTRACLLSSGC